MSVSLESEKTQDSQELRSESEILSWLSTLFPSASTAVDDDSYDWDYPQPFAHNKRRE